MKEENRDQLKAAIDQLPQYKAGPEIWDQLEAALEHENAEKDNEIKLQVSTALLPTYEAPKSVWRRMERKLGGQKRSFWLGRVAATVVILAAVGGLLIWQSAPTIPAPIAEQTNQPPTLDLPVAEAIGLSVLREQESELINCLEQHPDWDEIQKGETFRALQDLHIADSLGDGLAERLDEQESLREELTAKYCN